MYVLVHIYHRMGKMNFNEMTVGELEKVMRDAAAAADKKRATHKKDVRKQCLDLIKSEGLTLGDVFPEAAKGKIDPNAKGPVTNPETGEVWEGKGRKPKWLTKALREAAESES